LWRRMLAPAIQPTYERIAALALQERIVVVAAPFMFGARLAQMKLGVPLLSAYTAPALLRAHRAPLLIANRHVPAWVPDALVAMLWKLVDRHKLEPLMKPALHAEFLRCEVPLPAGTSIVGDWMHSPQGGLALFPQWFDERRVDWPSRLTFAGFPLHDESGPEASDDGLERFLANGSAPIVFMPGSAMRHASRFFEAAVQACGALGRRGILLTPDTSQVPRTLPPSVLHRGYVPFLQVLSRASALVHHGGIGSCAQAMRAGVPQIVMPMAHDQHDNARCVAQLNAGRVLSRAQLEGGRLPRTLGKLLTDSKVQEQCRTLALRMRHERAAERLCAAVESAMEG